MKEKNQRRRFVRELIDVMQTIDPDNLTQDFEAPKQWIHFDPYADTDQGLGKQSKIDMQFSALRYEDNAKLRASLVLDAYETEIDNIDVATLTFEEKERFERVINLLEYLKGVKVVDAPVLLKIFNLHR